MALVSGERQCAGYARRENKAGLRPADIRAGAIYSIPDLSRKWLRILNNACGACPIGSSWPLQVGGQSVRPVGMRIAVPVRTFHNGVRKCGSAEELTILLAEAAREIGFDYVAVVSAVGLQRHAPFIVRGDNYPEPWAERLIGDRLYVDDPVLHASRRSPFAFSWDELGGLIRLRPAQREMMATAARFGLKQGFTVPANAAFEPPGSCSFATRRSGVIAEWKRDAATLIGMSAIKTARRLQGWSRFPAEIHFSARETEVLEWMAEGKSNTDIAAILGIGVETVKTYVKAVLVKLGAADRTRAAVLAARWGVILSED